VRDEESPPPAKNFEQPTDDEAPSCTQPAEPSDLAPRALEQDVERLPSHSDWPVGRPVPFLPPVDSVWMAEREVDYLHERHCRRLRPSNMPKTTRLGARQALFSSKDSSIRALQQDTVIVPRVSVAKLSESG